MDAIEKPLSDLIESSGIAFKKNKISYIFDCPKCNRKDKLYIRRKDGRFVCWYCKEIDNFRGKAEFALCELLNKPLFEIKEKLYGFTESNTGTYINLDIKEWFGDGDEVDQDVQSPKKVGFPFNYYPINHKFSIKGLKYLEGRGIDLQVAQFYKLHYSPQDRRVIFPVEQGGSLLGWQGRTILDNKWFDEVEGRMKEFPKILTSEGLQRDKTLMFADRLIGSDHCVLTEGPITAIKAHLCGGNVATMGKAVSDEQVQLIRNIGIKKLYLALDPDAAQEVSRLVSKYSDLELYQLLPSGDLEDLGVMTPQEVYTQYLNAPRISNSNVFVYLA